MEGAANLADVMLVLACGLLLSLIVSWNLDIGGAQSLVEMEQGSELTAIGGLEESAGDGALEASGYEEIGAVYRDPVSGKLYMLSREGAAE
jgi:hypothetical protein